MTDLMTERIRLIIDTTERTRRVVQRCVHKESLRRGKDVSQSDLVNEAIRKMYAAEFAEIEALEGPDPDLPAEPEQPPKRRGRPKKGGAQ